MSAFSELSDPPLVPPSESFKRASTIKISALETLFDVGVVLMWVFASDWLLFHSGSYASWAAFLISGSAILAIAKRSLGSRWLTLSVLLLIAACALRLIWCGSELAICCGIGLMTSLAMTLNGTPPFLPDLVNFLIHVFVGSIARVAKYSLYTASGRIAQADTRHRFLLPLIVVSMFAGLFVQANPDLSQWVSTQVSGLFKDFSDWIEGFNPGEILFWILSAWIGLGLMHPMANYLFRAPAIQELPTIESDNYKAFHNTFVSVIVLFAVYLVFEFATLWNREFPKGFYYAGYAHEGAAWLTTALALATLILSLVFRGKTLQDPRLDRLKVLALIWSVENFLLAAAVVHRMFIYIDFNGMTRMRVIGLFGIACVAIGFGLVIYKIARRRDFLWLIRYQIGTVAAAILLYAILPVDYYVHRFNSREVLSGNLPPSVQIPTHETSAEGVLALIPLADCDDISIRDGIRATLADWYVRTEPVQEAEDDWRRYQMSDARLRQQLETIRPKWEEYLDSGLRKKTMDEFYKYAYQWY